MVSSMPLSPHIRVPFGPTQWGPVSLHLLSDAAASQPWPRDAANPSECWLWPLSGLANVKAIFPQRLPEDSFPESAKGCACEPPQVLCPLSEPVRGPHPAEYHHASQSPVTMSPYSPSVCECAHTHTHIWKCVNVHVHIHMWKSCEYAYTYTQKCVNVHVHRGMGMCANVHVHIHIYGNSLLQ